jgi:predicted ATP-grasp superfamily ATP-dependent carboligase
MSASPAEAQPTQRLKILLTEGSSTSARQTLYALGPRHTIDVLDSARLGQGRFSRYVRRWYRCPSFSKDPEGYLASLTERLLTGEYDVLFPPHEEAFLLARFRESLGRYAGLALPDFDALDRLMSKAKFIRLLDEVGLPHPASTMVHTREELERVRDLPCYVKVAYSTAGCGVRLVRNVSQLREVADEFEQAGWLSGRNEIVIQQPAVGIKGGMTGIYQSGRLVGFHGCESRAIGVGGSSMAQLGKTLSKVAEDMRRLGAYLNWHGAMSVEYFYEAATGQLQYYECNPRIGETVNALLSGANLCEQLVQISLGRQVEPLPQGREGVRTHQGFLILVAKALEGAGRLKLAAELFRMWTGRGLCRASEDELTRPREDWLSVFPALGVSLLLLAWPRAAPRLVKQTVENYSLHQTSVEAIRRLTPPDLDAAVHEESR